jgi:hypothetical protein
LTIFIKSKMIKQITLILALFFSLTSFCQNTNMKELKVLLNTQDPAWPIVKEWIDHAVNKVELLPKDKNRADTALYHTQVTTHSTLGAIIYETGGILIDNGWIRILGSGSDRLNRGIMDWNKDKSYKHIGEPISFLLIADDVLGGFFAINAGGIEKSNTGKVFYFAPDNLKWENLDLTYTEFINFCFQGDLKQFYSGFKWEDWINDISELDGNYGIFCYPYLWTKEGQDINKIIRKPVPIQELWDLYFATIPKN